MAGEQFVFGYGSLVAGRPLRRAMLRGHRRVWGVAMDNRVDIPGYKSYRASADGSRPPVYVAFLDIAPDPAGVTCGSLISVDDDRLVELDARERNYDRIEVSALVDGAPAGIVWTYRGSADGRARFAAGVRDGSAVIDVDYVAGVTVALRVLGCEDDVDPNTLPALYLDRVEIPPAPAG